MPKPSPTDMRQFTWLFECPVCGSLVLETAKDLHGNWHVKRGEADAKKGVYYTEIAKIPDDLLS